MENNFNLKDRRTFIKTRKEFLNTNPTEFEVITGIYFLIHKGVIVYIGQSINMYNRVYSHFNENVKEFDSVLFYEERKELLNISETNFIFKYAPKYNKNCGPNAKNSFFAISDEVYKYMENGCFLFSGTVINHRLYINPVPYKEKDLE